MSKREDVVVKMYEIFITHTHTILFCMLVYMLYAIRKWIKRGCVMERYSRVLVHTAYSCRVLNFLQQSTHIFSDDFLDYVRLLFYNFAFEYDEEDYDDDDEMIQILLLWLFALKNQSSTSHES